jgi:hypothetical protein
MKMNNTKVFWKLHKQKVHIMCIFCLQTP